MTIPELQSRGHRGNPMASFGELELLVDARRTVGLESRLCSHIPDLSPHGRNSLDVPQPTPPNGLQGKFGAFGGNWGLRIADGFTGQGAAARNPLARPLAAPFSFVCVCLFHNPGTNVVFDRDTVGADPRAALGCGGTAQWSMFDAVNNILGGSIVAEQVYVATGAFAADGFLRVNGALVGTADFSAAGLLHMRIGSANSSGADMNGLLGLLAFYRGRMRDATAIAIERFVDRDWNLRLGL